FNIDDGPHDHSRAVRQLQLGTVDDCRIFNSLARLGHEISVMECANERRCNSSTKHVDALGALNPLLHNTHGKLPRSPSRVNGVDRTRPTLSGVPLSCLT